MASIGQRNSLRVVRESSPGLYLDGEGLGEILLPGRYIPKGVKTDDVLDVFIYRDSEDRLVATTEIPLAYVGQFAAMKVVSFHPGIGAFLDWGLSKDLLLPLREQTGRVEVGDTVVVYVFLDEKSDRIVATMRFQRHLPEDEPPYSVGQKVGLLVAGETPLGYKAIIEGTHCGLIFRSDLGASLEIGQRLHGFIRAVRPDGKIDLALDPSGYERVAPLTEQILQATDKAGGRLKFCDQSSPEEIRVAFGCSKKAFKQALGALYRERRIRLVPGGIERTT
jgi:predicted RNA-binding protein (virulence factor B family)